MGRSGDDLQYAFAYYHFLAREGRPRSLADALAAADMDSDGSLSSNELLTLILQNKHNSGSVERLGLP